MKSKEEMEAYARQNGHWGRKATFQVDDGKSAKARGTFNHIKMDMRDELRSERDANMAMSATSDTMQAEREHVARVLGPKGKNR